MQFKSIIKLNNTKKKESALYIGHLLALRQTASFVATFDAIVRSRGKRTASGDHVAENSACWAAAVFVHGKRGKQACLESNNTSRPNNFWNAPPFPIKRSESELVRVRLQILSIEVTTEVACSSSCSAFLKELKLKVIFSVFKDTKQRLQHRIHHHYPLRCHLPDLLRTRFLLFGHIERIPGWQNRGTLRTVNWVRIPEASTTWTWTCLGWTSRAETKSVWTEWEW